MTPFNLANWKVTVKSNDLKKITKKVNVFENAKAETPTIEELKASLHGASTWGQFTRAFGLKVLNCTWEKDENLKPLTERIVRVASDAKKKTSQNKRKGILNSNGKVRQGRIKLDTIYNFLAVDTSQREMASIQRDVEAMAVLVQQVDTQPKAKALRNKYLKRYENNIARGDYTTGSPNVRCLADLLKPKKEQTELKGDIPKAVKTLKEVMKEVNTLLNAKNKKKLEEVLAELRKI